MSEQKAEKERPVFYLSKDSPQVALGMSLALWARKADSKGKHDYAGTYNGKRVAAYIQQSKKGKFLAFREINGERDEKNYPITIAFADIVVGGRGLPVLRVREANTEIILWADCSRDIEQTVMMDLGLDIQKLIEKRKEYLAKNSSSATK